MKTMPALMSVRPVVADDLNAWIALWNQTQFDPRDREWVLFEDALRPQSEQWLRLGAWTPDGRLVAIAEMVQSFLGFHLPGAGHGTVVVHPEHRRRGLGGELADRVEGFARECRLERLQVRALDRDLDAAGPFLERRGFRELYRVWYSVQDPTTVDLPRLAELRQRLAAGGIQAVPFKEIDSTESRRELWRAASAIEQEMPREQRWNYPPFEGFVVDWFESPFSLPGGIFVARDGDRIVGISGLERRPGSDAEVSVTGVLQPYRRRGIARTLKLMATRYAQQQGFRRVFTDNDVTNEGMLALNRELGFRLGPVQITFEKRF